MSFSTRRRLVLLLAAVITIAIPGISYAQLDLKGKAVETLTNGVMKELDKKFAEMVAKEALSAAVKANIVKNLSEMSRPIVKNFIDGASSGKLPNVTDVVNSVMRDVTPRVQELVKVALTDGGAGSVAQVAGQSLTAVSASSSASASSAVIVSYDDEKDFTVEIIKENNSARITKYNGRNTELKIPPRIGDRPVTEIGERVFMKKGLVSVAIPESVVFIGNMAFADNQIISVSIGANVYISNNAFENSGYNSFFTIFYNNQERTAGTYTNSWSLIAAPQPVRSGTGSTASAVTTAAAAPSNSDLNSVEIISFFSGWRANYDNKSSADISFDKEQIDGQERNVLTIDIKVVTNGWAGASLYNDKISQNLRNANGVRFKALGDGKQWRVLFNTSDVTDGCYHGTIITTKKGKVTDFDVPFSRLKQPAWGKGTKFNKNNIRGMDIQRSNDTGIGAAAIKVFDFEIY
jgi:hypothetical protein